jgi:hypothetical protein
MVHCNITYGDTMFTFEEQFKKYEQLLERTKETYEFWTNCVMSSWKDFLKTGK